MTCHSQPLLVTEMSDSDDDLPSFLGPLKCYFPRKRKKSTDDLCSRVSERNKKLREEIELEKRISEVVSSPLSTVSEQDNEEEDKELEEEDKEEVKDVDLKNILIQPNVVQYYNLKEITLNNCGYDSVPELSDMEQFLLSLDLEDVCEIIYSSEICGIIQNVNPLAHFILKTMSVHPKGVVVVSACNVITSLLASTVGEISFKSEDIFQILFNCVADVKESVIFNILPAGERIEPDPCIPKEPVPQNWLLNLKSVLSSLSELLGVCTISEKDLARVIVYFLMMSEVGIDIHSELQMCLVTALQRVSPDTWPIYRSEIARKITTFQDSTSLHRQWHYIYTMVKSIPASTSNGAELQRYTSFLSLVNYAASDDTLEDSFGYSNELFCINNILIFKDSLIDCTTFQHYIIKTFDLLVNRLEYTTEEYKQLQNILRDVMSNVKMSFNLVSLAVIQTRITLTKLFGEFCPVVQIKEEETELENLSITGCKHSEILNMAKEFEQDALVWAKMKGFPPWPARIDAPSDGKRPKSKKPQHYVFFFGTHDFAWILDEHIFSHSEEMLANARQYKKKSSTMQAAIQEIENMGKQSQDVENETPTSKKIGFLGLGVMGRELVKRLLRTGHTVTIWNRSKLIIYPELVELGARPARNPADVIRMCDIIFCCVFDAEASKSVVFGMNGVLDGFDEKCSNKAYVEMSSIDAVTSEEIAEAIAGKGGRYIEAPMIGSRQDATAGSLVILTAGDKAIFAECRSIWSAFCKHALYISCDVGSAANMSALLGTFLGTCCAALTESLALIKKCGVNPELLMQLVSSGPANFKLLLEKGQAMITDDPTVSIPIKHQHKSLAMAVQLGHSYQQPSSLANAAHNWFLRSKKNDRESDVSAILKCFK